MVNVRRTDKGYKAFAKRVRDAAKAPVALTVGVHSDASGSYENGPSVLEVATWAEFGLGQPQRSFLRAWVVENRATIDAVVQQYGKLVASGAMDRETAIGRMGELFVNSMRGRMVAGIAPPNAASTVRRKGSSTPLIDHGILKASIDFKAA